MTTTTSTYLSITQHLSRYQAMVGSEPAVKTATEYYAANIGKVQSISDLVGNYRLLSYALDAYGLGDQVNNKALVTKVLEGGVTDPKALANTLSNPNWAKFAAAFNFSSVEPTSPGSETNEHTFASTSGISAATTNYVEEKLESEQGQQDPGVQLALYFQRVAPTVANGLNIMGDANLLDVVQTIFNLPPENGATNVNVEASEITKLMPLSQLQDPKELTQLTERFSAMYDLDYGPGGVDAGTPLTVNTDGITSATSGNAATSILSGLISGNSTFTSSSTASYFNSALLASVQRLNLGG